MTTIEENTDKEIAAKKPGLFRVTPFTIILLTVFILFASARIFRAYSETKKEYRYLSLFSEVVSLVKNQYVEKVKPGEKFPGAFSGMLRTLDKYSTYLDQSKTTIYNLYRQNKACGCGIYGMNYSGYFQITDVTKNSPAGIAGVKPGNIIRAVNGKSIFGWSFWQMYLSLLTEKPAPITLLIVEDDPAKPLEIKLQTQYPKNDSILETIDKNITLVELTRIDDDYVKTVKKLLSQDYPQNSPLKLIIDLRKYDGGDIEPFIELTTLFFNRPIPLTLKLKKETKHVTLGSDKIPNYRAVALIDKSTMMYGELLAFLFKNYGAKGRITLVGSKTRGFTSKMAQFRLDDDSSILLTEGFFFINGDNPAKTGVAPDVEIKRNDIPNIIAHSVAILDKTHIQNP